MTEKEVQLLGFEKREERDSDPFHYYYLHVVDGLSFISNASNETEDGEWFIEIFDTRPAVRYYNFGAAVGFINNIKRHIIE